METPEVSPAPKVESALKRLKTDLSLYDDLFRGDCPDEEYAEFVADLRTLVEAYEDLRWRMDELEK